MRKIESTGNVEHAASLGLGNPQKIAHLDVAHAGDGVTKAFNDVANRELVGELCQVNDPVVVR